MSQLVLSLFPGIGLLDMAFEAEGFCVVRGPDLLWGGDIRKFSPPTGKFDGVIGGPPCQAFSRLRHIIKANGYQTAPNLIPEFERVVGEAEPLWFVMENVPDAPMPEVRKYVVSAELTRDVWCGGQTDRLRRFSFGHRSGYQVGHFQIETEALHWPNPARAVTCDTRQIPVAIGGSGKKKAGLGGALPRSGKAEGIETMLELQGLPRDFFGDDSPLTASGKKTAIGNGVPTPMGLAVARAVKRAMGLSETSRRVA